MLARVALSTPASSVNSCGISVLILEKTVQHADRVRGEFVVPWGVAEARTLGLLEDLVQAGAHTTTRTVPYGEGVTYATAQAQSIDLSALVPGVGGALNIGHPAPASRSRIKEASRRVKWRDYSIQLRARAANALACAVRGGNLGDAIPSRTELLWFSEPK